jgi:hypothetical protein
MPVVYATRGLIDVLLEQASERDPESTTIKLGVTPAGEFDGLDLDPETPVLTHFYLPDAGQSVSAVFGVDLSTPSGRTPGLFISHPDGVTQIKRTDDLREIVLIAVPPWDHGDVVAIGRDGARQKLELLDAEPPEESLS